MAVDEKDAFGCMANHDIKHPDMILCMNEVSSNMSQKGDVASCGEKIVCHVGTPPKKSCFTKSKNWTLI